jgi:hypothetical protein
MVEAQLVFVVYRPGYITLLGCQSDKVVDLVDRDLRRDFPGSLSAHPVSD